MPAKLTPGTPSIVAGRMRPCQWIDESSLRLLVTLSVTGIALTTNTFWGSEWMEELHEAAANLTLILIALHIAGVIFTSFQHRENLVKSMISGFKRKEPE